MASLTSRPFYPQGKSRPITIVWGGGVCWALDAVWTLKER
jgi:hypothetical protein